MPKLSTTNEQAFPVLPDAAIQRVQKFGETKRFSAGDVLVAQGEPLERFFIVLDGEVTVEQKNGNDTNVVARHGRGEFFGEVNSLSGRPSLVAGIGAIDGTVHFLGRFDLQSLMQNDSELGEVFMRAFILRRIDLLSNHKGDVVILGSPNSGDTLRVRDSSPATATLTPS